MKVVLKKKNDNKKLYFLGALMVVAVYLLWPGGSDQPTTSATSVPAAAPTADQATLSPVQRRGITARGSADFRPKLRSNRPEDRIDPNKVDPTLRLDLLAKLQDISLEGGLRNLFQFGVAPPPPAPKTPLPNVGKIAINHPPPPVVPVNPGPPPAPPVPPIPLKYYGFTNAKTEQRKKAFFLDGEDIIVAWEGDTVKSRYKIVRIGVNSVEMEDTQFKNRQTLPLEPEAVAG